MHEALPSAWMRGSSFRRKAAVSSYPFPILEKDEREREHGHSQERQERRGPLVSKFLIHLKTEQWKCSYPHQLASQCRGIRGAPHLSVTGLSNKQVDMHRELDV